MFSILSRRSAGKSRAVLIPILLAIVILCVFNSQADAGPNTIASIEVRGLKRMTRDAFIFASGLKTGQSADDALLRDAFRRLWERKLFSDLRIDVEDSGAGQAVIFTVTERPVIVSIDFDTVKAITRSNIDDRFRERGVDLAIGKPVDRSLIHRAADTVKDLLGEKGYLDATVKAEVTDISEQSTAVRFRMHQGPRTRIRDIEFIGNKVYSDRILRKTMKLTKQHGILSTLSSKDIYFPAKYDQDIEKVRELYQNQGYLDLDIKPPQVDIRETKKGKRARERAEARQAKKARGEAKGSSSATPSGAAESAVGEGTTTGEALPAGASVPGDSSSTSPVSPKQGGFESLVPSDETPRQKKKRLRSEARSEKAAKRKADKAEGKARKWVYLTIRVQEGDQYRLGELTTSGNTVFTDKVVLSRIPLRKGAILSRGALDVGTDLLRRAYGSKGYIYATVDHNIEKKEGNFADVTVEIREDRPYRVDRIEFEGNSTTRDQVLRREMRLDEGALLNKTKLEISTYKLNQLGYIAPVDEPIIEPIPGTDRARIRIKTEEKGKNEIQVGGGYSGNEGFFFAGSYQTHNFLGRGETLGLSLQAGGRTNNYTLSFTEPWFLGKPYTLGFNVFRRDSQFARQSTRSGSGGSVVVGRRLGDFGDYSFVYSFETIKFTDVTRTVSGNNVQTESNTRIGSLTPSIGYNRINDPFRPSSGHSISLSAAVAGSYLGGENNYYKPLLTGTQFFPMTKRTYFGIHGEAGYLRPYGGSFNLSGQILGLPRFERFFLGGEFFGPRTFQTRSISPARFISRDGTEIAAKASDIITFKGRNLFGQRIEKSCRTEFDFTPLDGRCENGLRQVLIGGDRYLLTQFEYNITAGGPFVLAAFVDAGTTGVEDRGWDFSEARISAGIEARIYLPVFQAPLRFIYGKPLRQQRFDSTNSFQFSIGSSF